MQLASSNLPPLVTASHDGFLDRLLAELFGRIGYAVRIVTLPPRRGMLMANKGTLDGDAGRMGMITATYPDLIRLDSPIIDGDFVGLSLDPAIRIRKAEDFAAHRVGYVQGWHIAERLFAEHPDVFAVRTPALLLRMLASGRVDVAFLSRAPARLLADDLGIEGILESEFFLRRNLFVHLHRRHADLVGKLTRALAQMHDDGTYARIVAGYYPGLEQGD